MPNVSLSTVGPVVKARIAADSIQVSRGANAGVPVAFEGYRLAEFLVSHGAMSAVGKQSAKHPLAIVGRFLVKTGSRRDLLLRREIEPASALLIPWH